MLFHKLLLLLPTVLLADAAPTGDSPHSLAEGGSPPPPDSRPPVTLDDSDAGAHIQGVSASSACTGLREFYGLRRWTYVQAKWCLTQDGTVTRVTQQLADPWYYWGGAWYRGGDRRLSWKTTGKVSRSGGAPKYFNGTGWNDGAGTSEVATLTPKLSKGDYELGLDFHLEGPYWGADAAIDAHVEATGLHLD